MQTFPVQKQQLIQYAKKNWFKISLGILLLFLVLKKDLSFQINLNTPLKEEFPVQEEGPSSIQKPARRETFTDKMEDTPSNPEQAPIQESFDLSPFASLSTSEVTLENQLKTIEEQTVKGYIKRFAHVAESEQLKFKVPASITLANALLQSQAGQHSLAKDANNHFGLLCTPDWIGETLQLAGVCFRDYENAWTSFRDHSLFLTTGQNANLQQLGEENYKAWANALEKINFARQKNIADQIVRTIEKYQLYRFDAKLN